MMTLTTHQLMNRIKIVDFLSMPYQEKYDFITEVRLKRQRKFIEDQQAKSKPRKLKATKAKSKSTRSRLTPEQKAKNALAKLSPEQIALITQQLTK